MVKPKKRSKKDAEKEFLRRSRAAKKGWKTRRKKEKDRLKKQLHNASILERFIPRNKRQPKKPSKKETLRQENERLKQELASRQAYIDLIRESAGWPDMAPEELLRIDGTVAVRPSRARRMTITLDSGVELDGWDMHMALKRAKQAGGEKELSDLANFISRQLDIPLREVYTLLYSP